jgi:predicted transcriptional regulator
MNKKTVQLTRRERQIIEVIHAKGKATVAEVQEGMSDAPSYSAVRALMRILEEKGAIKHRQEGLRYVYSPTENRDKARRSALKSVLKTFFDGSLANAVAALVDAKDANLTADEIERLEEVIKKTREK